MIRYTIITGILKSGIFTIFGAYYDWVQKITGFYYDWVKKKYRLWRKRHILSPLSIFLYAHVMHEVSYSRVRKKIVEWKTSTFMIRYTKISGILKNGIFQHDSALNMIGWQNYPLFRQRHFCLHILSRISAENAEKMPVLRNPFIFFLYAFKASAENGESAVFYAIFPFGSIKW